MPPWDEPDAPTTFEVLLEDEAVLAVAKPSGLPTLPGGGFLENTLLHVVRARAPGASPLHRLGRFTSGVVLFAKNPGAHRALSEQWRRREVFKRYRALGSGSPARDAFEVEVPIGPVPYGPHGTIHAASASGKPARTRVVVVRRNERSFVADVVIETGRPHQIRIHLAASGFIGAAAYMADRLQKKYKLPKRVYPFVHLVMGYPAEEFPPRPRYPLEFTLFEDQYPELTDEMIERAMRVMNEGYLAQDYYRHLKAKIRLVVDRKETFTYDNYSWTEHISRKWGQWEADPKELLEPLGNCGFMICKMRD